MTRSFHAAVAAGRHHSSGGPSAYNYSALWSANGWTTGWVLDGKQSACFQDSAGTTPCAATNDPLGNISNIVVPSNPIIQTLTANMPVFNTAGGIKWFTHNYIGSVNRFMTSQTPLYVTDQMTVISVHKNLGGVTTGYGPVMSNYNSAWPGGYFWIRNVATGAQDIAVACSTNDTTDHDIGNPNSGPYLSTPSIVVFTKSGNGTNQGLIEMYGITGTLFASLVFTANMPTTNNAGPINIGYNGYTGDIQAQCFNLLAPGVIGGTDKANIIADLVARFTSTWAP